MSINRTFFHDRVKLRLYVERGMQYEIGQRRGCNSILDVWERDYPTKDDRWLAYCLATAYHETAFTMQPISEYGKGKGRRYGARDQDTGEVYFGRGYVQLTWKENYAKFGIEGDPDRALEPEYAAYIMFRGMMEGMFTGKKLRDYIYGERCNFRDARRIINGLDCAERIAVYAEEFYGAISYTTTQQTV